MFSRHRVRGAVLRRRSSSATALIGLLSCLVLACGCPTSIPPPDNAIDDPAELRAAIDGRLEGLPQARFKEVVLDYFGKDERVKLRMLILVAQPDGLRVQTRLPGSDEIMSLLVSSGDTFAMHRRDTNEYFTGRPTRENVSRLLPIDLSAKDVVRIMLGGAPWDRFDDEGGKPALNWDTKTGRYHYSAPTRTGGKLEMQVRHTDYAVVALTQKNASGEVKYRYETDDWEAFEGGSLPGFRRFEWPERDLDFSITLGETQTRLSLPETLFQLPPPPGSTVVGVDN